ncbi:MAG: signal recognition particle-docking protein FtsY [Lachnospiraceae bacterium]|jgi:fused signal recognition particle receptor|nr:signal recognition particle-docking protein FtsY [Lachnospiraceae bacterium]
MEIEKKAEKKRIRERLREGLAKTRGSFASGIDAIFGDTPRIYDEFYEELLEVLVMADVGIHTAGIIIDNLREDVKKMRIKERQNCKQLLIENIKRLMSGDETDVAHTDGKTVILVIGVNGVGKTTSVGKLAALYTTQGKKVVIAAADTYRAAAAGQLSEWANRAGADMVGGSPGADPASVVYDAINATRARSADVLICDTAGRLHNKKNLMEELRKINRIIEREMPEAKRENLLVVDGTTGQNALVQAREFGTVAAIDGLILTKLDGTARGGIAISIHTTLDIPVRYIGVGEQLNDLHEFVAADFVDALFSAEETV